MNALIRHASLALMTATAVFAAPSVHAQSSMDHSQMKRMDRSKPDAMKMDPKPGDAKEQTAGPMALTEGEVRKVDKGQGKVTLKHGEITHLGMPGMTMVFQAQDKSMLDSLKDGDKVRFAADMVDNQLIVTRIEQAR